MGSLSGVWTRTLTASPDVWLEALDLLLPRVAAPPLPSPLSPSPLSSPNLFSKTGGIGFWATLCFYLLP